jgi:hypothetical protein
MEWNGGGVRPCCENALVSAQMQGNAEVRRIGQCSRPRLPVMVCLELISRSASAVAALGRWAIKQPVVMILRPSWQL